MQCIIACGVAPDLAGHYAARIGDTPHIVDGWVVAGSNAPGEPPPIRLPLSILGEIDSEWEDNPDA